MFNLTDVTAVCKVLVDIGIPADKIEVGRSNVDYYELDNLVYVVDISSSNIIKGVGNKFFAITEQMLDQELQQAIVTINIYGKGAYQKTQELSLLLKTQDSVFSQKRQGILIRETQGITDLKNLIGTQQKERAEMTFKVDFINDHTYSTKRVDNIKWGNKDILLIEK